MKSYAYLAMGDSYTIGEQVSLSNSFPYQTVQLLRQAGHSFYYILQEKNTQNGLSKLQG